MVRRVIKTDIDDWAGWLKRLGTRLEPALIRGIMAGGQRCLPLLQDSTRMAPPASTRGRTGAIDTGLYLAAWATSPIEKGVRVFNSRPYSGVIESGRRPSAVSREGIRNIKGWAKRKLQLSDAEAESAAWAIASTLREKQLVPRKVMTSIEENMIEAVEAELLHELDVELAR